MSEQFRTAEQNRAALIMHRTHGYIIGAIFAFIIGLFFGLYLFWTRAQIIGASEYLFAGSLNSLGLLSGLAGHSLYFQRLSAWYSIQSPSAGYYITSSLIYPSLVGVCFVVISTAARIMIIRHLKTLNTCKPDNPDKVEKLR